MLKADPTKAPSPRLTFRLLGQLLSQLRSPVKRLELLKLVQADQGLVSALPPQSTLSVSPSLPTTATATVFSQPLGELGEDREQVFHRLLAEDGPLTSVLQDLKELLAAKLTVSWRERQELRATVAMGVTVRCEKTIAESRFGRFTPVTQLRIELAEGQA